MKRSQEQGSILIVICLVACIVLLFGSLGFGLWAYSGRQDFKNNSDKKIAVAVETAKTTQEAELNKAFEESQKSPLKKYTSSPTYGSISFDYPRTWSMYLDETNTQSPIIGYLNPVYVPAISDKASYALKIELTNTAYEQVINQLNAQLKSGKVTAAAFIPELLKDHSNVQPGVRFTGEVKAAKQGVVIVMKVRDKTLKISSDGKEYLNDLNTIILKSLTFSP